MAGSNIIVPEDSNLITENEDGSHSIDFSTLEAMFLYGKSKSPSGCDPCAPVVVPCSFCWALGSAKIKPDQSQTLTVFGAPAGRRIGFTFFLPNGQKWRTYIVADTNGQAKKTIGIMNGPGLYRVEPDDKCGCQATPGCATFDVEGVCPPACATVTVSTCEDPCENAGHSYIVGDDGSAFGSCAGAVTVLPYFGSSSVISGNQVQLRINVTNANVGPVTFTLNSLVLPAGLTGTVTIPPTVINGGTSADFYFTLTAVSGSNTTVQVVVGNGNGVYVCNDEQFSASGGAATVDILAASGGSSCDLRIESLTWNPASIANGGTTQLALVLKNYGSTTVGGITFSPINMPGGFSGPAILQPANGTTIAPGASLALSSTGTILHSGNTSENFTVLIPSGTIAYACGDVQKTIGGAISSTVAVAAASQGFCQGTLTFDQDPENAMQHVRVTIVGGLPNTDYSYVTSGTAAMTGTIHTDGDGFGSFTYSYVDYQWNNQLVVNVTGPAPGNCTFPTMSIILPQNGGGGGVGEA